MTLHRPIDTPFEPDLDTSKQKQRVRGHVHVPSDVHGVGVQTVCSHVHGQHVLAIGVCAVCVHVRWSVSVYHKDHIAECGHHEYETWDEFEVDGEMILEVDVVHERLERETNDVRDQHHVHIISNKSWKHTRNQHRSSHDARHHGTTRSASLTRKIPNVICITPNVTAIFIFILL